MAAALVAPPPTKKILLDSIQSLHLAYAIGARPLWPFGNGQVMDIPLLEQIMSKKLFGYMAGTSLSGLLLLASLGTAQASECKGLEEKACGANSTCSWVKARTKKDGKEVKAHCRGKGGKKAAKANTAPK
jgi:hypothetical protein